MTTNGEDGGSSLLPVAAVGEGKALRTKWCEGVLVLAAALAKALVGAPALGVWLVLRVEHVRRLL